jgi:hypothetical protein
MTVLLAVLTYREVACITVPSRLQLSSHSSLGGLRDVSASEVPGHIIPDRRTTLSFTWRIFF